MLLDLFWRCHECGSELLRLLPSGKVTFELTSLLLPMSFVAGNPGVDDSLVVVVVVVCCLPLDLPPPPGSTAPYSLEA